MVERFVTTSGTISIANGESTVTGSGTAFGTADREGAQIWAHPTDAAPYRIGTVAAVVPRGEYEDLSLPLVHAWNGEDVVSQPYELVDGMALAQSATLAAVYARFTAFLEQSMGLVGRKSDDIDYSIVPENSFFPDPVTKTIYQWHGGVLEAVYTVAQTFAPKGPWVGAPTSKTALTISTGDVAVNYTAGALDADGRRHFELSFNDDFELQLPTNVAINDVYDVLFVADGAGSTPAFDAAITGEAASSIGTADGARTRMRFTVTAVSSTTATAVTAELVTFAESDMVDDGGDVYVSNADDNSAEPTGASDANWTLLPIPSIEQVLNELGIHGITISESDPSGGVDGDLWLKVGA